MLILLICQADLCADKTCFSTGFSLQLSGHQDKAGVTQEGRIYSSICETPHAW